MAYQIQYGKSTIKERIAKIRSLKNLEIYKWAIIGTAMMTIFLLGHFGALDFLIPGDREVTKEAFNTMVEDVREGESVSEAITAFCEEIFAGAEYKD
jgi:hypothetical protein